MASSEREYDYLLKLHIAGGAGVGKTSLLLTFVEGTYPKGLISKMWDSKTAVITMDDKTVKLQIWDCAEQGRVRTISKGYSWGAQGIVLVFDITDREHFNNIEKHLEAAKHDAGPKSSPEIILVGTKSDLAEKRVVSYVEAKEWADLQGYQYIETSAQNGDNVKKVFSQLAEQIAQKEQQEGNEKSSLLQGNRASYWSSAEAPPDANEKDCCLKRMCAIL